MNKSCMVAIPAHTEEIVQSKILFKHEWAELLMEAEEKEGKNGSKFHVVPGVLETFSGGKGIVSLSYGIIVALSACYIRIVEE